MSDLLVYTVINTIVKFPKDLATLYIFHVTNNRL